jgi:hypothetical protein
MIWHPIETAPNYVSILVSYDDGTVDFIEDDDNDYEWKKYDGPSEHCVTPTYWMPLPEPPEPTP